MSNRENDPTLAVTEVWEPGIAEVTVNLYDEEGTTHLAATTTDSWDESNPTDCKWGNGATGPFEYGGAATDCYDGLRNFNQVRPGVFDGGYAFGPEILCEDRAEGVNCDDVTNLTPDGRRYLKSDGYTVEVVPPPGYEIIKPEDKNVDFGDEYIPTAELAAAYPPSRFPACVGEEQILPPYLTLYPDEQIQTPFTWIDTDRDGIKEYVETLRPLCDRKEVFLSNSENRAVDFSLSTEVPVAAHAVLRSLTGERSDRLRVCPYRLLGGVALGEDHQICPDASAMGKRNGSPAISLVPRSRFAPCLASCSEGVPCRERHRPCSPHRYRSSDTNVSNDRAFH